MARFIREVDEVFTDEKRRSLKLMRVTAFVCMIAVAVAVGAAGMAIGLQPVEAAAGVIGVIGFGLIANLLLVMSENRLKTEQHRMQNLYLSRRAELQELAGRDDLTQLQNRRFFYEQMQQELDLAERYKRELSILMIDVDDLKLINDEFGHQVGDVVLRSFGRVLNQQAGDRNITARIGGDEFAVILPGASRKDADKLAWAIWDALSKEPICETENASIFLGVSVGTGGYPWGGKTLDEIIHWADTKLYANKLERKGLKAQRDTANDSRLVSAVVDVLSSALDIRDKMTHRHARRVARMTAFVAREMNLTEEEVLQIEYAAALHDIGKIGVADSILHKQDSLEPDEWMEMKRHSELGYQILNGIDFLHEAAEIVYSHHERFDGMGYPRGLKGEEMPLGARVFAVVDAYDAMTSRRPYREAMRQEDAVEEILRNSGTQFDPIIVAAFLRMIQSNPDGIRDEGDEFGSKVLVEDHAVAQANGRKELTPID
jgi:diguanylate cyclase (GGDEF)-like protein/putative nucleotidyltransferase with HDIG domain